jgi:hypothetical protein
MSWSTVSAAGLGGLTTVIQISCRWVRLLNKSNFFSEVKVSSLALRIRD